MTEKFDAEALAIKYKLPIWQLDPCAQSGTVRVCYADAIHEAHAAGIAEGLRLAKDKIYSLGYERSGRSFDDAYDRKYDEGFNAAIDAAIASLAGDTNG